MRTMLVAVAVAIAAFFGIIGAFFFVAGLGGSAELGYSHFYTKVSGVPSPISRSALIVAGIMFLILAVYTLFLLRRLSSPNVASQGSLDAISGVGVGVRWLLIFLLIAAGLAVYGELAPPPNPPLPRQAATVKEFIAAINRKDYAEARALGGKNVGIPYSKFVSGFATTAYDRWSRNAYSVKVTELHPGRSGSISAPSAATVQNTPDSTFANPGALENI
jgi:hypothetical protein